MRRHDERHDRQGRDDINAVQALLLFNIGNSELTAGELRSRGYYLGSNVSYNLKKLVETGQLDPTLETVAINTGHGLKTLDAISGQV